MPEGAKQPFCYILKDNVVEPEYCTNKLSEMDIYHEIDKSQNPTGEGYIGTHFTAANGKKCENWKDYGDQLGVKNFSYVGDHNKCRNPLPKTLKDANIGAMCIIEDKDSSTGYNLEECPNKTNANTLSLWSTIDATHKLEGNSPQIDYRGTNNKTHDGTMCKNWLDVGGEFGEVGDHNFCRNPTNAALPWCMTSDNSWNFCCPKNYKLRKEFGVTRCVAEDADGNSYTIRQQATLDDIQNLSVQEFDEKYIKKEEIKEDKTKEIEDYLKTQNYFKKTEQNGEILFGDNEYLEKNKVNTDYLLIKDNTNASDDPKFKKLAKENDWVQPIVKDNDGNDITQYYAKDEIDEYVTALSDADKVSKAGCLPEYDPSIHITKNVVSNKYNLKEKSIHKNNIVKYIDDPSNGDINKNLGSEELTTLVKDNFKTNKQHESILKNYNLNSDRDSNYTPNTKICQDNQICSEKNIEFVNKKYVNDNFINNNEICEDNELTDQGCPVDSKYYNKNIIKKVNVDKIPEVKEILNDYKLLNDHNTEIKNLNDNIKTLDDEKKKIGNELIDEKKDKNDNYTLNTNICMDGTNCDDTTHKYVPLDYVNQKIIDEKSNYIHIDKTRPYGDDGKANPDQEFVRKVKYDELNERFKLKESDLSLDYVNKNYTANSTVNELKKQINFKKDWTLGPTDISNDYLLKTKCQEVISNNYLPITNLSLSETNSDKLYTQGDVIKDYVKRTKYDKDIQDELKKTQDQLNDKLNNYKHKSLFEKIDDINAPPKDKIYWGIDEVNKYYYLKTAQKCNGPDASEYVLNSELPKPGEFDDAVHNYIHKLDTRETLSNGSLNDKQLFFPIKKLDNYMLKSDVDQDYIQKGSTELNDNYKTISEFNIMRDKKEENQKKLDQCNVDKTNNYTSNVLRDQNYMHKQYIEDAEDDVPQYSNVDGQNLWIPKYKTKSHYFKPMSGKVPKEDGTYDPNDLEKVENLQREYIPLQDLDLTYLNVDKIGNIDHYNNDDPNKTHYHRTTVHEIFLLKIPNYFFLLLKHNIYFHQSHLILVLFHINFFLINLSFY